MPEIKVVNMAGKEVGRRLGRRVAGTQRAVGQVPHLRQLRAVFQPLYPAYARQNVARQGHARRH